MEMNILSRLHRIAGIPALFILFLSLHISAQTGFQKTMGGSNGDVGYAVYQTSDKGFLTGGYTSSFGAGRNDIWLAKTDTAGNLAWSRTYGGPLQDYSYDMHPTADGGTILCGYSQSWGAGGFDAFLLKTNAAGDTQWTKAYGGPLNDFGNRVQQTTDGGYIMAGYTLNYHTAGDSGSAYLVRTDANGNLLWSTAFGGSTGITDAYDVKQTNDKGFIITGYTNALGDINGDVFLVKTDSMGQIQFTRTYGGKGTDWGTGILLLPGGYLIGATIGDSAGHVSNPWLIWTNLTGDTLKTRSYGGPGFDYLQYLCTTTDGGVAITGFEFSYGLGSADGFLIKTNSTGDTLYTRLYGTTQDDEMNAIHTCADQGFVMSGFSNGSSLSSASNLFLIRTDSSGKDGCVNGSYPILNRRMHGAVGAPSALQIFCSTHVTVAHPQLHTGGRGADLCTPAGIQEWTPESSFYCFPNPVRNTLFVHSDFQPGTCLMELFNVIGQRVNRNKLEVTGVGSDQSIDISALENGVYILQLSDSKEKRTTRFVILH
ncbi:MAG: T9SS type A sorting domain-containing protein [Bacteroidia bacterium]